MTNKIHRRDEHLVDILLNKQLEKYNTTIESLILLPRAEINGVPWFQYYTFDSEFKWLDLNYGLKHNY